MEESIEYFASTRKIEKCELTLEHLENLEVVADNGGWEEDKLATLFKVKVVVHLQQPEKAFSYLISNNHFDLVRTADQLACSAFETISFLPCSSLHSPRWYTVSLLRRI